MLTGTVIVISIILGCALAVGLVFLLFSIAASNGKNPFQ
jgi:hypothetical protein